MLIYMLRIPIGREFHLPGWRAPCHEYMMYPCTYWCLLSSVYLTVYTHSTVRCGISMQVRTIRHRTHCPTFFPTLEASSLPEPEGPVPVLEDGSMAEWAYSSLSIAIDSVEWGKRKERRPRGQGISQPSIHFFVWWTISHYGNCRNVVVDLSSLCLRLPDCTDRDVKQNVSRTTGSAGRCGACSCYHWIRISSGAPKSVCGTYDRSSSIHLTFLMKPPKYEFPDWLLLHLLAPAGWCLFAMIDVPLDRKYSL